MNAVRIGLVLAIFCASVGTWAQTDAENKAQYVDAVVHGKGYLPWMERGLSEKETAFRKEMEDRKTRLLAERAPVHHPVMLDAQARERALRNVKEAAWARGIVDSARKQADFILGKPDSYIDDMIGETTPWYDYCMTCPNCVGVKSQEGNGHMMEWSSKDPDKLTCRQCGQVFPSPKYPQTQKLVCPRMGQTFTFYMNPAERAHPEDRTGKYAYKWLGHPMHMNFSGVIAQHKTGFMMSSASDLALTYVVTGDPRYARKAQRILLRLATCYRGWLYHDYLNTVIDTDPLYAAWHDTQLELEWKRNPASDNFKNDRLHHASVFNFWGAGRYHPSTDNMALLTGLARSFDFVADATDENGKPLWSEADKTKVERDLFLEWIFTGEPYLGGPDQANLINNKTPRLYNAFAAVACALNLPRLADTALRGYELVRDRSFTADGFSVESPGYTMMYLQELPSIPELLHDFKWPAAFAGRKAAGDLYNNERLRMIYAAMIDQLRPDGTTIPFEDSNAGTVIPGNCIEMGLKRYPDLFGAKAGSLGEKFRPGLYSLFNLDAGAISQKRDLALKDLYFPAWMTALLRHGTDRNSALLALNFSPPGGHRHGDNLTLYYMDHGNVLLGDHGYVGDSPVNTWITSTLSHNLVVVDGKNQLRHSRDNRRTPKLEQMLSTPRASACEAASNATSATEFRRLVILLKGPDKSTCAVDIFRVRGGKKHAYQLFSEIASSDAGATGSLVFDGVTLPPEPPLPNFGATISEDQHEIFGLRDAREAKAPAAFAATWTEPRRRYRFWCLGQVDKVAASNGPGQETYNTPGRRVRYLNLIHEGSNGLTSTFIGVHEPSLPKGSMPVKSARRLEVPAPAGASAVAIEIKTVWGDYIVLSEFADEATVAGVTFKGKLGIFGTNAKGKAWYLASGATTLRRGKTGFSGKPAEWTGTATAKTGSRLTVGGRPAGWSDPPQGCQAYVILNVTQNVFQPNPGRFDTGYPVAKTTEDSIQTERFPIPAESSNAFRLAALRYGE